MFPNHSINLIYALWSRIQLCRDYALFWGALLAKNLVMGGTNILRDRAV